MELQAFRLTQRADGKVATIYLTAVPAEVLHEKFEVFSYDAGKRPNGYQRRPSETRFREIARYVLGHEGLLPTSILVNIRAEDGVRFDAAGQGITGNGPVMGTLWVDNEETFWVVDGQHRLYGLQEALIQLRRQDPEATLGYDVPVVITVGENIQEEMRLFYVVNSKAKSIATDLAADLIRRTVMTEGRRSVQGGKFSDKEFRKAIGTHVAEYLNSTPGPWQGQIRLPNESANRKRKPLQLNAIASSLEPALRDSYVKTIYEPELKNNWPTLCRLVYTYWVALSQLMPEAFADIEQYNVQRTAGTYAFHWILPDVMYRCRDRANFSVEGFKEVLRSLGTWVESHTWHKEEGDSMTKSTGMASMKDLADEMRDMLPSLDLHGQLQGLPGE